MVGILWKKDDDFDISSTSSCEQSDALLTGTYGTFLYDLKNDPYETTNLYNNKDYDWIKVTSYNFSKISKNIYILEIFLSVFSWLIVEYRVKCFFIFNKEIMYLYWAEQLVLELADISFIIILQKDFYEQLVTLQDNSVYDDATKATDVNDAAKMCLKIMEIILSPGF